jgi:excisionase family DNA binding protein
MNHSFVEPKERIESANSPRVGNAPTEPVWDCHAVSDFLRIHPATVKRLARQGRPPGFRIGNRWRFRRSELDAWAHSAVPSSHSLRRE